MRIPAVPPRRIAPGFQFAAAALVLFLALLGSHLATPLYAIWQQRFGLSTTDITVIFSCYPIGVLGGLLFGGRLADQLGRKPMILSGVLLTFVSSFTYLAATGMGYLVAARLINGFAMGLLSGAATAAIVELHPTADRAAASRIAGAATLAAPAAGLLLATVIAALAPPDRAVTLPFELFCGALALALVLAALFRETIPPESRRSLRTASFRPQALSVPRSIRGTFIFAAASGSLAWANTGLWLSLGPLMVQQVIGTQNRLAGGLTVVFFLTMAGLVQLVVRRLDCLRAILLGVGLVPPGLVLILLTLHLQNIAGLVLGAVVVGAAQGLCWMGASELVNIVAPREQRASILSVLYFTGYLSAALPIIVTGVIADRYGLFTAVLLLAVVFLALAAVLIAAARRRLSQRWA